MEGLTEEIYVVSRQEQVILRKRFAWSVHSQQSVASQMGRYVGNPWKGSFMGYFPDED